MISGKLHKTSRNWFREVVMIHPGFFVIAHNIICLKTKNIKQIFVINVLDYESRRT